MRSPDQTEEALAQLDLYAENHLLRTENDDLRYKVSFLESQVDALRDALAVVPRET